MGIENARGGKVISQILASKPVQMAANVMAAAGSQKKQLRHTPPHSTDEGRSRAS
jgi:hypothetical protein